MVKVFQINSFGNLSTGCIACNIYEALKSEGHTGIIAYGRGNVESGIPNIRMGSKFTICADVLMSRLTDHAGFFSKKETNKLIRQIEKYQPDIVHLHNLHGYYIKMDLLFEYLRITNIPVIWTLHDCWAYTGHCCYYSMNGCNKWKTHCYDCHFKHSYPASLIDDSKRNFERKRDLILSMPNLTLVAVSRWLASEIQESFLKELPIEIIQNGIDVEKFRPTRSDFREKYGLKNKKIVLGVASTWDVRKGLNDFIELSKLVDSETRIVLVGLNDKQRNSLPWNIIGLPRTKSVNELSGLYSTADAFFNASVEETFGLPTIEAMACGTPVIVYNATALPEIIDEQCGFIVKQHDLNEVSQKLRILFTEANGDMKAACIKQGRKYSKEEYLKKYMQLYACVLKKANKESS